YNNVPIGLAVYSKYCDIIVTVPRRRHGAGLCVPAGSRQVPSAVGSGHGTARSARYGGDSHSDAQSHLTPILDPPRVKELVSVYQLAVDRCHRLWVVDTGLLEVPGTSLLTPIPEPPRVEELVSVYRPVVDRCHRLWVVDTGLLEVPGTEETQPQRCTVTPDSNPRASEGRGACLRVPAGSRQVPSAVGGGHRSAGSARCQETGAASFDSDSVDWCNFPGLTSITVEVDPASCEDAHAYINDLATETLIVFSLKAMDKGDKGPNTQSGSHAYHSGSRTIFFANVAQDAILCWNVDKPLTPQNVGMAAQDHKKL
ncbi:Yellow-f4, partial [Operophtera brumata]